MEISKINEVTSLAGQKEDIKFTELREGNLYKICGAKVVVNPVGETILLELVEKQLFSPKRCTEILKNELEILKSGNYLLLYNGQKIYRGKATPVFEIKLI